MVWRRSSYQPLDISQFELAFYWVRHDGMWFVAEFLPSEQEFFFCRQYDGFRPCDLEAVECEMIVQPSHLINEVWENGKCVVKAQ